MKKVVKYTSLIFAFIFLVYLSIPAPDFPKPQDNVYQSLEPADIETTSRKGYYTDNLRYDVLNHYSKQFSKSLNFIPLPTYRLNYPPEEAQEKIRDQTRSTYLEEIVHPFRESIYVNGFEPSLDKDIIIIDGKNWAAKVIVRYIQSNSIIRVTIGVFTIIMIYVVYLAWNAVVIDLFKLFKLKKWIFR